MLADAVESASDIASSLLVYGGLRIAVAPPDADHPYGHGKAEPLTALLVSILLLLAAAGIAIQSLREIATPHHAPAPFTLVVLVCVIVIKESLARFVLNVGDEVGSTALRTDAWHHRSDALTSAAAFVGISVALAGGKGYESADDWAALLASGIISWNAVRLLRPALAEVMDAAPPPETFAAVRSAASGVAGVEGLDKCHIRKMGFDFYVDLHIYVAGERSVSQGHEIAHRVKDAVRTSYPKVKDVLVHVEPSPAK